MVHHCLVSAAKGEISYTHTNLQYGSKLVEKQEELFQFENIRVLVAEDNPINQDVTLTILRNSGIVAEIANNGLEAVQALEKDHFDLVLMDVQMPVMDGLEATRVIRDTSSQVLNHRIPIIAMTANAMKSDRDRCIQVGMDDYISKPFETFDLLTKIAGLALELQETPTGFNQTPVSQPYPPIIETVAFFDSPPADSSDKARSTQPVIQFDLLCRRVLEDKDLACSLIQKAVGHLDTDLVEINQAIQNQDLNLVKMLSHKLKGTAATLSAEPLRKACEDLESASKAGNLELVSITYNALSEAGRMFQEAVDLLLKSECHE